MSNNSGFLHDVGSKAQELADSAKEKITEAGKAVKETVQSGYEKVTNAGSDAGQAVKEKAKAGYDKAAEKGSELRQDVKERAESGHDEEVREKAHRAWEEGKTCAAQKVDEAANYVGSKMREGGEALQGH